MSLPSTAFVVLAEFLAPAEHFQEFLDLCRFDSERSTTDEPGCQQFDVSTPEDTPNAILLYEVYADRAAFDQHMQTPHYATFAAGVERLQITITRVRFLSRQHPTR